jgi:hypothetical protein
MAGKQPQQAVKVVGKNASDVDKWLNGNKYIKVKSSNVLQIRYEKAARKLWVIFKGNAEYHYRSVMTHLARQMFFAPSMGKFVWKLRRMGYVGYKT